MSTPDPTADDIKFMIDVATQQLAHHREQVTKWQDTLQRLQKTQQSHTTQTNAYKTQIQGLETELAKAKTSGPAPTGPTTSAALSTSFNTPISRQPFATRQSLLATSGQINASPVVAAPPVEKKKVQIAKALYKYDGMAENNVMSLTDGEHLIVHNSQGDWYLCQRTHDRQEGYGPQQFAPRNYLQLVEEGEDLSGDCPPSAPNRNLTNVTVRSGHATPKATAVGSGGYGTMSGSTSYHSQNNSASGSGLGIGGVNANSGAGAAPASGGVAAMAGRFGNPEASTPTHSQGAMQNSFQRTPSVQQASSPMNQQQSTSKGPPPFRGSVGPSGAVVAAAAAASAGIGATSKGPPPFRGSVGPMHAPGAASGGFGGPPPKPVVAAAPSGLPTCVALFDYQTDDPTLLSFSRGDIFTIVGDTATSQWWRVKDANDKIGFVPSNFVKKN